MSNLLKDASILLTPTGYDNGKMLSIKPEDGDGDFTFSRNSAATRVNAQGLVENVQILSSNKVQNGNFSEIGLEEVSNGSFSEQGSELIVNGDFATDSNWGLTNFSIINEKAVIDSSSPGYLIQTSVTEIGKTYRVEFTVSDYVEGRLRLRNPFINNDLESNPSNGTYVYYGVANDTSFQIQSRFSGEDYQYKISNVSVKEVGQDWTLGTGWSIGDDKAIQDGTGSGCSLQQSNILVVGKTYKITYEILERTQGSIQVFAGFPNSNVPSNNTIGVHTHYIKAEGNTNLYLLPSNFIGSIDNVSVKEVGQDWIIEDTWTIGNSVANGNGANGGSEELRQSSVVSVGKEYKATWEIKNYVSGSLAMHRGTGNPLVYRSGNEVFTEYWTATSSPVKFRGINFIGDLTNIVIKEITNDTDLPRINYEGFSYQDSLGSEEIVNGTFSSDTAWNKGTGWSISGGSANGLATLDPIYQLISGFTAGKKYKVSFEITEVTNGFIRVYSYVGASGTFTKVLETTSQIGTYEVIFEFGGTNKNLMFYGSAGGGNFTGSIDNVSVKEYLGQEVVPDSGCGSWLLEDESTNLLPYSEDYSNPSWSKSDVSVVNNNYISPAGTTNASLLYPNTSGTFRYINDSISGSSSLYTISVYAKVSGKDVAWMYINSSSAYGIVYYDLSDKTIEIESGSTSTPSGTITDAGNGWYRLTYTVGGVIPITSGSGFGVCDSKGSTNVTANGTDGLYFWGAMLEQQSYATSYIPTSDASNTRNRDIASGSGNSTLINSTEGTLYFEGATLVDGGSNRYISLIGGSSRISILFRTLAGIIRVNGTGFSNIDVSGISQDDNNKIAVSYSASGIKLFINGVLKDFNTDNPNFPNNSLNSLDFDLNGTSHFFGKAKALAVYKEALTDAELTCLTTI